jgi:hypothetical protein
MPARVIVTEDAPSFGVLAAVRALKAGGYEPWVGIGAGKASYAARSRACAGTIPLPDPALESTRYLEKLVHAAERIAAVAVLPGTEQAVITCAGRGALFGERTALGTCDARSVAHVTDKEQLPGLGEDAGFRSPPFVAMSRDEIVRRRDVAYPVVIKTPHKLTGTETGGLHSNMARWVSKRAELLRALDLMEGDRFLLQPFLGTELEAYAGLAWRGDVICVGHQVADRIFPPYAGISAYARTVPTDPAIEGCIRRLISSATWSGIFEVQLLRHEGEMYLIDFNPHMYGSLSLAVAAGLNLPMLWTDLLLGRQVHVSDYRVGVRYRNEERDIGALFAALIRREWGMLGSGLVPHSGTVHAVFSARDPVPVLGSLRHLKVAQQWLAETQRELRDSRAVASRGRLRAQWERPRVRGR